MTVPFSDRPPDYECPFCALVRGLPSDYNYSRSSDIVYRDATVTALVASHQYARSRPNILVIPNEHYENIFDLPVNLGGDIFRVAQQIAYGLKHAYQCDGISTRQHNGRAGSQHVWHYHLHVTPRFTNDNFYRNIYDAVRMPDAERAEHAARLSAALAKP